MGEGMIGKDKEGKGREGCVSTLLCNNTFQLLTVFFFFLTLLSS